MKRNQLALLAITTILMMTACTPQAEFVQIPPGEESAEALNEYHENEELVEAAPTLTEDTRLKEIWIGVPAYPEFAPWVLAADEKSQADEYTVHIRVFANEQEAVDALLAGRINLAASNDRAFLKLAAKDGNLRLAALQSIYSGFSVLARKGEARTFEEMSQKIASRDEALAATIRQMKGRYWLVPGGSAFHPELEAVLQLGGLDANAIHIVNMEPEPGAMAFLQGSAAFFSDGIKQRVFLEENGAQNVITANDLRGATLQFSGLFTTRDFLEENPKVLEKALDAWYRAVQKIADQPDESNEKMAAWLNEKTGLSYQAEELNHYQERGILIFPDRQEYAGLVLAEGGDFNWRDRFSFLSEWLIEHGEIQLDEFDFNQVVDIE